jgi:di/tricarboxylate transporter
MGGVKVQEWLMLAAFVLLIVLWIFGNNWRSTPPRLPSSA